MYATAKRHAIKHARGNGKHHSKKSANLMHQIGNLYSHSIKRVKKKPYQTAGVFFGLGAGALSSVYIWYRFIK